MLQINVEPGIYVICGNHEFLGSCFSSATKLLLELNCSKCKCMSLNAEIVKSWNRAPHL